MTGGDAVESILERQGFMLLDGGLATELEARGHDLDDELWSARLLVEQPEAIRRLHLDYLEAGADCIVSASYQATLEGFRRRGLGEDEGRALLRTSVRLAVDARDEFVVRHPSARPLVAASIGPYGAFLADGSEYRGDYDLDEAGLRQFHRTRWEILSTSGADLLACETIPSLAEARALVDLLDETEGPAAWVSFSCRDEARISDGTEITEAVVEVARSERVIAVGVNCTAPRFLLGLISRMRAATEKPLVVYPNSGETYDPRSKRWARGGSCVDLAGCCREWRDLGARLLGGCCRTGPADIRKMRETLTIRPR